MDDKNWIKIEGKGKEGLFIAESYLELIDNGFDLTIETICKYLSCTPTHFINTYRNEIKHIIITTKARDLLFLYDGKKMINLSDYEHLVLKRVLYNKEDFNRFILENLKMECKYKTYTLEDLKIEFESLSEEYKAIDLVNYKLCEIYGTCLEPVQEDIVSAPIKLYSMRDLKQEMGFKYDMEVYRLIESKGVNKYKLGNLVRYDINDFINKRIIINYNIYDKLGDIKIKKIITNIFNDI